MASFKMGRQSLYGSWSKVHLAAPWMQTGCLSPHVACERGTVELGRGHGTITGTPAVEDNSSDTMLAAGLHHVPAGQVMNITHHSTGLRGMQ